PGFSGGHVKNPACREVVTGRTGHDEVAHIIFAPAVISSGELLELFWKSNDPRTFNRVGKDVGTHYRSVSFYNAEKQKQAAEQMKAAMEEEGIWADPIVTEIVPFEHFYPAEDYHRNYFNMNQEQPYCSFVIKPKVEKLERVFANRLK